MPTATIDELFAQTLKGDYDNDKAWDAIHALRATGSREVFDKSVTLCRSDEPLTRARGADILAQFGHTADNQTTLFADESFPVLAAMLDSETDPVALSAIITAFGHLDNPSIIRGSFLSAITPTPTSDTVSHLPSAVSPMMSAPSPLSSNS
jgi:HEAT repeat protein